MLWANTYKWHYMAFVMFCGVFIFKVMPFGLNSAPATFQCMIGRVLGSYAAVYFNDIVIFSTNWKDHLQHV